MREEYKKAFAEVSEIITMMPKELKSKIPQSFIEIIEREKLLTYQSNIKEPLEEQKLMEETVVILGLIYRDFLCSKEERIKLKEQDIINEREFKEELNKQYSIENIFEKRKQEIYQEGINQEENRMVVYQEKWYHKLWNIIKIVFRKR